MLRGAWSSHLCGRTLELQQHHGAGTLHDVEVEQIRLIPVETQTYVENDNQEKARVCMQHDKEKKAIFTTSL